MIIIVLQRLKLWFTSIVTFLMNNLDMDPTKRLVSATCVTYCIYISTGHGNVLFMSHDPEKFLLPLAGMLAFHPDLDVKNEYLYLESLIPLNQRYVQYMYVIICTAIIGHINEECAILYIYM